MGLVMSGCNFGLPKLVCASVGYIELLMPRASEKEWCTSRVPYVECAVRGGRRLGQYICDRLGSSNQRLEGV